MPWLASVCNTAADSSHVKIDFCSLNSWVIFTAPIDLFTTRHAVFNQVVFVLRVRIFAGGGSRSATWMFISGLPWFCPNCRGSGWDTDFCFTLNNLIIPSVKGLACRTSNRLDRCWLPRTISIRAVAPWPLRDGPSSIDLWISRNLKRILCSSMTSLSGYLHWVAQRRKLFGSRPLTKK